MPVNRPAKILPGVYRLWQPVFATGTTDVYNSSACTQLGQDYELFVASYQQFGTTSATRDAALGYIRSGASGAGHEVAIMVYLNGTYAAKGSGPGTSSYPDRAYVRAATNPSKFLSDGTYGTGDGTWLMALWEGSYRDDPGPGYGMGLKEIAIQRRETVYVTATADGWMLDSMGKGVVKISYNRQSDPSSAPPTTNVNDTALDPKTGLGFDSSGTEQAEWLRHCVDLAAWIRGAVAYADPVSCAWSVNGFSQGSRYFDTSAPVSVLADGADGCVFESWLRAAGDGNTTFRTENEWIQDVNAVIDLQNKGKYAMLWTKVWEKTSKHTHTANSSDDDGDTASIVKWHRNFVASFMMCTDGTSFAHFRHDNGSSQERIPKDRWYTHLNSLGEPVDYWNTTVGSDGLTGGVAGTGAKRSATTGGTWSSGTYYYRRRFDNGMVLHNPTSSAVTSAVISNLVASRTYKDVDGTTYNSDSAGKLTLTLAAQTGYALLLQ